MGFAIEFAIVAVLVVSLIFSMFGQGGGSLYTPVLLLLGYTALVSVSTSLVLNLVTALFATLVYYRQKLVDLNLAVAFIPGIVAGAFLGGAWGNFVNTSILLGLFVVFLLGAGARMVYSHWEKAPLESPVPRTFTHGMYVVVVAFSFAVGILSGLLGVGGGVLIVPFLIYAFKTPTKVSAGTSGFIVIFSSMFGVLGHSAYGHLDLPLILATGLAVAVGGTVGARFMVKTTIGFIKVGFGLILWAFAFQLIVKLIGWG